MAQNTTSSGCITPQAYMFIETPTRIIKTTDARTYANSPIVIINLGPNEKQYHIHADLLVAFSQHFAARLKPRFSAGHTITVDDMLDIGHEPALEAVVHWLYGGDAQTILGNNDNTDDPASFYLRAIKIYVVAVKFEIVLLQVELVDALRAELQEVNHIGVLMLGLLTIHDAGMKDSAIGELFTQQVKVLLAQMVARRIAELDAELGVEMDTELV